MSKVNPSSADDQATAHQRQGFLCNWTGSFCPSGCGSPCKWSVDRTHCGGGIEVVDYNAASVDQVTPSVVFTVMRATATGFEQHTQYVVCLRRAPKMWRALMRTWGGRDDMRFVVSRHVGGKGREVIPHLWREVMKRRSAAHMATAWKLLRGELVDHAQCFRDHSKPNDRARAVLALHNARAARLSQSPSFGFRAVDLAAR